MVHFTYKITDLDKQMYYIGYKSTKNDPYMILGVEYFSSSSNKLFIKKQKDFPQLFKYEILEIFDNKKDAYLSEQTLLKFLDVNNNPKYYNGRTKLDFDHIDSKVTTSTVSYLGKLIKLARKERGISQSELMERVGIGSRVTIKKIEDGDTSVAIGSVFECCFVLGIPILGGESHNISNLSSMLGYMNILLPKSIPNRTELFDDF